MKRDSLHLAFLSSVLCFSAGTPAAAEPVRVWEEKLVLPTYAIGKPDPTPLFDTGRVYQRAHAPIYPYFILDTLTGKKSDRAYEAVYLENEFVKVCIIPELGGRLFSAFDKINGYDYIYRQSVIKPGLVGMLGAWISGGIEWDLPHHHRASTFMPVSYRIEEGADGTKTVWVGEIELRHRMKWLIGMTLRPGSTALEITGKLLNRTPVANSFLHFANIAVHANQNYQVIFPPGTEYATNHHKKEFSRWPVADNVYNNIDFRKGVDVSQWKNHPSPISMFAWGGKGDFVAGYDHGKQAGTVHVGSVLNASGMKFFTWGAGREGEMWDELLTDSDGPYVELMAGAYSDNQPDYTWVQPYETKVFRTVLYPIHGIAGVKAANGAAAVNLTTDAAKSTAQLAVLATGEYRDAVVKLQAKGAVLFEAKLSLTPAQPFLKEVALPPGVKETDLLLSVSSDGKELIYYRPAEPAGDPWPEAVVPPPAPSKIESVEELYFTAQRMEQFHTAGVDPEAYYREALRREPKDTRANTAMGVRLVKRGSFKEAEGYLRTALLRPTHAHTTPKDGEPSYYLGLALAGQNRAVEARRAFERASWSDAWQAAATQQLAELEARGGDSRSAISYLDRSLSSNPLNTEALNLKAALLRASGSSAEVEKTLRAALVVDPLDRWAEYQSLTKSGDTTAKHLRAGSASDPNPAFEIALGFLRAGQPLAATKALECLLPASAADPMWRYYLAFAKLQSGDRSGASQVLRGLKFYEYSAPFRIEDERILEAAIELNPGDALAYYLLGNALIDRHPERAIKAWEKAGELDPSHALTHRNLAFAYWRSAGDLQKALRSIRVAIRLNPEEPRFLLELDQIQEAAGTPPDLRLKDLEGHLGVASKRDDVYTRLLALLVVHREFDRALGLMRQRQFNMWEGIGKAGIHEVFVDALLCRGQQRLKADHAKDALADFEAALGYPAHLGTPQPMRGARYPEIYYWIGTAHEALGRTAEARTAFEQAVAKGPVLLSAPRPAAIEQPQVFYCQALAMRKLGRSEEANRLLELLRKAGDSQLEDKILLDFFTPYGEPDPPAFRLGQAHYALALAHRGLGSAGQAQAELEKAIRLRPAIPTIALYFATPGNTSARNLTLFEEYVAELR